MSAQHTPSDVLEMFVGLFASKGWLNQTLRIRHAQKRYRICCSEKEFFAYRINDHGGVSPGFAGWPVCIVTSDRVIEDSDMSAFTSVEPSVSDWLRCMADADFELL